MSERLQNIRNEHQKKEKKTYEIFQFVVVFFTFGGRFCCVPYSFGMSSISFRYFHGMLIIETGILCMSGGISFVLFLLPPRAPLVGYLFEFSSFFSLFAVALVVVALFSRLLLCAPFFIFIQLFSPIHIFFSLGSVCSRALRCDLMFICCFLNGLLAASHCTPKTGFD